MFFLIFNDSTILKLSCLLQGSLYNCLFVPTAESYSPGGTLLTTSGSNGR